MIKNNDGIITVKLLLIIVSMIAVFSVLLQGLTIGFNSNHDLRNKKLLSDNILADYDTYLYVNYGLYGVKNINDQGVFNHSLAKKKEYEPKLLNSLQETSEIYQQIEKLMLIRLPVNYTDQLLSKLDIIKKAKSTQDDIALKNLVDTSLNDLGRIFDNRILLCQQINKLTNQKITEMIVEENSVRSQLKTIQNDYLAVSSFLAESKNTINQLEYKLPAATAKEKLRIRTDISSLELRCKEFFIELNELNDSAKSLVEKYEKSVEILKTYKNYNQSLIEVVISVAEKTKRTEELIDDTLVILESSQEGIEVVKEFLMSSLEKNRDQLYKESLVEQELDLEFKTYMSELEIDIDAKWYAVIQTPYKNKKIIESINFNLFKTSLSNYLQNADELYDSQLATLVLYEHVTEFPSENTTSDYNDYYHDQRLIEEKKIEVTENIKIEKSLTFSDAEKAKFWKVVLLDIKETMKVSVVTNEYILSTFKSYADPSLSDYDYFDKYTRSGYFNKGEIEYILMGESSETLNIMETTGLLLGVRTIMNGIHIYTDTDKLTLSESIGISVAGWTGFGAPLVSNVLRVCWATGESFYDMSALIKGESVPFYKIYPNQWHFDLGIVYEENTLPKYLDLLNLTYHDYLRFMLLTLSNETKLKRVINLIELNLYQADRPFDLSIYYTKVELEDYQRGFYE